MNSQSAWECSGFIFFAFSHTCGIVHEFWNIFLTISLSCFNFGHEPKVRIAKLNKKKGVKASRSDLDEFLSWTHGHVEVHKLNERGSAFWNQNGAWTNHKLSWIHTTHHNLKLEGVITLSFIIYFATPFEVTFEWSFFPWLLNMIPKTTKLWIL
jgi:hypothetical protein